MSGFGVHTKCNIANGRSTVSPCASLTLVRPGNMAAIGNTADAAFTIASGDGPSLG